MSGTCQLAKELRAKFLKGDGTNRPHLVAYPSVPADSRLFCQSNVRGERSMSKYRMAQLSASLSLFGSFLLFYAFQATSTGFVVYTNGRHGEAAMCVGDPPHSMLAVGSNGEFYMGMRGFDRSCSQGKNFAVINTDSPQLARFGWIFVVLGFVLQVVSTDRPIPTEEERRRLKKLRNLLARQKNLQHGGHRGAQGRKA
jgi:hypothetical protein